MGIGKTWTIDEDTLMSSFAEQGMFWRDILDKFPARSHKAIRSRFFRAKYMAISPEEFRKREREARQLRYKREAARALKNLPSERRKNVIEDHAFQTALQTAIDAGLEQMPEMDRSYLNEFRIVRFYPSSPFSSCGSPAEMCAERGEKYAFL